jgi:hypothetical protein
LLSGDLFDVHYRLLYTITLFSEIGNYFVNIHNEIRIARNGFTAVYNAYRQAVVKERSPRKAHVRSITTFDACDRASVDIEP